MRGDESDFSAPALTRALLLSRSILQTRGSTRAAPSGGFSFHPDDCTMGLYDNEQGDEEGGGGGHFAAAAAAATGNESDQEIADSLSGYW